MACSRFSSSLPRCSCSHSRVQRRQPTDGGTHATDGFRRHTRRRISRRCDIQRSVEIIRRVMTTTPGQGAAPSRPSAHRPPAARCHWGIALQERPRTVHISLPSMAGLDFEPVNDVSDTATDRDPISSVHRLEHAGYDASTDREPCARRARTAPIGTTVTVQFSEAVVFELHRGRRVDRRGAVSFNVQQDGTTFTLSPNAALENNSLRRSLTAYRTNRQHDGRTGPSRPQCAGQHAHAGSPAGEQCDQRQCEHEYRSRFRKRSVRPCSW
jgi:hypothetical protein